MHYVCCVLYFSYYYTVIDNEIVMLVYHSAESVGALELVFKKLDGPIWGDGRRWTPEVCCYVQSTLESHCCQCRF